MESKEGLILTENRFAAIDALFSEWNRPDSPGAALVILHQGQVVYEQGYGSANLEYRVPIKPQTIFHVASVSKQFTVAAILLLAQEGKLSVDDEIHRHLPELPDFGHPITIRHLIHHTSGLRDQWELLRLGGLRMDDVLTHAEIMRLVQWQRALNFEPGSEHLYCNTGYTLMAEIVQRVSGQSLRAFAHSRLFEPLGMQSTHFHDDHEELVPGRAYSYKPDGQGGYKHSVLSYANVGATSLFTTVQDLARWLLHFERPVAVGAALIERMLERGRLNSGEVIPYAGGLMWGEHRGLAHVGHGGADAGYRTVLIRFPEQRLGIAILSNLSTFLPGLLARRVAEVYLGDRVEWGAEAPVVAPAELPPVITLPAEALLPYTGNYYSEELQITYRVRLQEGELRLFGPRREELRLLATGAESFREPGEYPIRFTFLREGGTVIGLKADWGRVRHLQFVSVKSCPPINRCSGLRQSS